MRRAENELRAATVKEYILVNEIIQDSEKSENFSGSQVSLEEITTVGEGQKEFSKKLIVDLLLKSIIS